ncbi:MAG: hypothetical protein RRY79_07660 [Clostridia bacterium]
MSELNHARRGVAAAHIADEFKLFGTCAHWGDDWVCGTGARKGRKCSVVPCFSGSRYRNGSCCTSG